MLSGLQFEDCSLNKILYKHCPAVQTVMKHAVEHYFGGGSELLNMHERMADLLLIALSSSFEDAGDCQARLTTA